MSHFLFIRFTLEMVNWNDQVLHSNEKKNFFKEKVTYLCKYGEGNSEGWQRVQAKGVGETQELSCGYIESIQVRSQKEGCDIGRDNSTGKTDPGKRSHSNAETKSVSISGSIVNNIDTDNFTGTETLCTMHLEVNIGQ